MAQLYLNSAEENQLSGTQSDVRRAIDEKVEKETFQEILTPIPDLAVNPQLAITCVLPPTTTFVFLASFQTLS